MVKDTAANPAAQKAEEVSCFSRQHLHCIRADRRQRGDSQSMEVSLIVKGFGISEIPRSAKFGGDCDPITISQRRKAGARITSGAFFVLRFHKDRGPNSHRRSERFIA